MNLKSIGTGLFWAVVILLVAKGLTSFIFPGDQQQFPTPSNPNLLDDQQNAPTPEPSFTPTPERSSEPIEAFPNTTAPKPVVRPTSLVEDKAVVKPLSKVAVVNGTYTVTPPKDSKGFLPNGVFFYDPITKIDYQGHTREGFTPDCKFWYNPDSDRRVPNPGQAITGKKCEVLFYTR